MNTISKHQRIQRLGKIIRRLRREKVYSHGAGILDVAGCINIFYAKGARRKAPRVIISGRHKRFKILEYLKEEFGGCLTHKDDLTKVWIITHQNCKRFLTKITPHMKNTPKQELAQTVIDYYE